MGRRDKNGKRLKWTSAEEKSVLEMRGRAEELGKYPAQPYNYPRQNQRCHLAYSPYSVRPMYSVYGEEPYHPIQPFQPEFFPVADDEGPSSGSRAWAQATPTVNSVVVVPGHDEKGGNKMEWGDAFSDAAITPDLPNQSKAPSPEGTKKTNDCDV